MQRTESSRSHVLTLTLTSICLFTQGANAKAGTVFVAVSGSDSWSGLLARPNVERTDGPLAKLDAACRVARGQGAGQSRKVVVQAGQYILAEPLLLTAADAGLTIEAAPGADVRLYGGKKITGWTKDGEKFYSAALPGVREKETMCCLAQKARFSSRGSRTTVRQVSLLLRATRRTCWPIRSWSSLTEAW